MKGLIVFVLVGGIVVGGFYAANVGGLQETVGSSKPKVGPTPIKFQPEANNEGVINLVKWVWPTEPSADRLVDLPKLPIRLEPGKPQTVDVQAYLKLQKNPCVMTLELRALPDIKPGEKLSSDAYRTSKVTHNICTEGKTIMLGYPPQAKK